MEDYENVQRFDNEGNRGTTYWADIAGSGLGRKYPRSRWGIFYRPA